MRETGNLVFHLALVLILAAVAVGGLFGWRGNVIVKEGASVGVDREHDLRRGFTVTDSGLTVVEKFGIVEP